ncbi:MAG: hypothetical protein IAE90_04855 [Ignavibacteria bacterium]|mgnify:CR=1 FL=1|nr:hypothetical protein [Ignavibacteria bacterium]
MLKPILKTLIALLFVSAALSTNAYAGDDFGSPEEKAAEWTTWLSNKVGLTSDQYNQVYNIYLRYAQQYKADKEKKSGKIKGGFKSYRKKANEEIRPLLNADQQKKWKGK